MFCFVLVCVELFLFSAFSNYPDYPELQFCLLRLSLASDFPNHGLYCKHYLILLTSYCLCGNCCHWLSWHHSCIPLPVFLATFPQFPSVCLFTLLILWLLVFPWGSILDPIVSAYIPWVLSLSHESKHPTDTEESKISTSSYVYLPCPMFCSYFNL